MAGRLTLPWRSIGISTDIRRKKLCHQQPQKKGAFPEAPFLCKNKDALLMAYFLTLRSVLL